MGKDTVWEFEELGKAAAATETYPRQTLPADLQALTTFELRAGVTADEVKRCVEDNLTCLSDNRYRWTIENLTSQTRYKVYQDGKLLGFCAVSWDANGRVVYKPSYRAEDHALLKDWLRISWDMIWVDVLRKFGQFGDKGAQPTPTKTSAGNRGRGLPQEPGQTATRDDWCRYKYECDRGGVIRFTHRQLADKIGMTEGAAKNYYNQKWKPEHGEVDDEM